MPQRRDEHGYPVCPLCQGTICPGQSVAVRARRMVHVDCLPIYRATLPAEGSRAERGP